MCKRLICLISFVLVLALTGSASADLVAHWSLDNDAADSVGSLNWTLNGGAGYSTDAKEGSHSLMFGRNGRLPFPDGGGAPAGGI
ncbi:MAG: hypothetical protein ISS70_11190 [Phycisphaerae bacterium]|nr:hypothetical protein [Phycisphaerae bacterium]